MSYIYMAFSERGSASSFAVVDVYVSQGVVPTSGSSSSGSAHVFTAGIPTLPVCTGPVACACGVLD